MVGVTKVFRSLFGAPPWIYPQKIDSFSFCLISLSPGSLCLNKPPNVFCPKPRTALGNPRAEIVRASRIEFRQLLELFSLPDA